MSDLKTYRFKREFSSMNNKPSDSPKSSNNIINIVNNNRNKSPCDNKIEMNINQYDIKYYVNNGNSSSRLMIIGRDKEKISENLDKEKSESIILSDLNKTNSNLDRIQHSHSTKKADSMKSLEAYQKKFFTINESKSINVIFSNESNKFHMDNNTSKKPSSDRLNNQHQQQFSPIELRKRLNRRNISLKVSKIDGHQKELQLSEGNTNSNADSYRKQKDNFRRLNMRTNSNDLKGNNKETPIVLFHRKEDIINRPTFSTLSGIDCYSHHEKKSSRKMTIPLIPNYNSIDALERNHISKDNSQSIILLNSLSAKQSNNTKNKLLIEANDCGDSFSKMNKDNQIFKTFSNQQLMTVEEEEKNNKTIVSNDSSLVNIKSMKTQKSLTQRVYKSEFNNNSLLLRSQSRIIQSSKFIDNDKKINESLFSPKLRQKNSNHKPSITTNSKPFIDTKNSFFNKRNNTSVPNFFTNENKGSSADSKDQIEEGNSTKFLNKKSTVGVNLILKGKQLSNYSKEVNDKTNNKKKKNSNTFINKSLEKSNNYKKTNSQSNRNISLLYKGNSPVKKSYYHRKTMISPNMTKCLSQAFHPVKTNKKLQEENSIDYSFNSLSNSSYTQIECEKIMLRIFNTIDNVNQLDHMLNASFSYDDIDFNSPQYQNNLHLCEYLLDIVTKRLPTLTALLLCKKKFFIEESIKHIKTNMDYEKLEDHKRNFMSEMVNKHDFLKENDEIEKMLAVDNDERIDCLQIKLESKFKDKILSDYQEVTNLAVNVFSEKKGFKRLNKGKSRRKTLEIQCIITQSDLIRIALEKAENTMFALQNIQKDLLSSLNVNRLPILTRMKKKKNITFSRATSTPRHPIQRKKTQSKFSKSNTLDTAVEAITFAGNKQIRVTSPVKHGLLYHSAIRKKQNYDFSVINRMRFNKHHKKRHRTRVPIPVVPKISKSKLQRKHQSHFSTSNKDRMLMNTYHLKQKMEQTLTDDPYALIAFHIREGNYNKVDNIFKKNFSNLEIDYMDEDGNTFLNIAAQANEFKLCQYFLKKSANPNIQNVRI